MEPRLKSAARNKKTDNVWKKTWNIEMGVYIVVTFW